MWHKWDNNWMEFQGLAKLPHFICPAGDHTWPGLTACWPSQEWTPVVRLYKIQNTDEQYFIIVIFP
jgi:hypothetical protein